MGFEPQKFFIGLIDFFAVWLPGAFLTYFIGVQTDILRPDRMTTTDWAVFLFASYLIGHLVFLAGSFLDGALYDRVRQSTSARLIGRLASGGWPPFRVTRALAGRMFAKDDRALREALRLRDAELGPIGAAGAVNAFQWCKAKLALNHPEALAQVERFEADSKFFRSFCVILVLLALWEALKLAAYARGFDPLGIAPARADWWRSAGLFAAGAAILFLALWRFAERRAKATSQAYWLALAAPGAKRAPRPATWIMPEEPTHAGGVVLRRRLGREVEYLRVEASDNPAQWVLPKGHIEHGEEWEKTAVREVLEEAAIWARVHDELRQIPFEDGKSVRVKFFLMEYCGTDSLELPEWLSWLGRGRSWLRKWLFWLPDPKRKKDDPRRREWAKLSDVEGLRRESQLAVREAAAYLEGTAPPPLDSTLETITAETATARNAIGSLKRQAEGSGFDAECARSSLEQLAAEAATPLSTLPPPPPAASAGVARK